MSEFQPIVEAGALLLVAVWEFARAVVILMVHYWGLALFVAYWLFAVRWPAVWEQVRHGAWVGILLLYFLLVLTWGMLTPPVLVERGIEIPGVLEKFLLGGLFLLLIMLCGLLQESLGMAPAEFEIAGPPEGDPGGGGHGGHGGHGHDDHHH